ncbi:MAG: hypothetical protein JWP12_1604 [Bacteroidetes bacterium]|nr:hypothetical protein [Bacteroidota bacterium]
MKYKISKSTFMKGTQCLKAIFMHCAATELRPAITIEQQAIMDKGTAVGIVARQLYRGGIDVTQGGKIRSFDLIEETKRLLNSENQIFYEPAFATPDGNYRFQADIFVTSQKKNKLIEVKSSTSIKLPEQILDVAFQYYVLKQAGYDKDTEIHIAYLNKAYVLGDTLDINKLFIIENVTTRAKQAQVLIERHLQQIETTLNSSMPPKISIGSHCFKPRPCGFMIHCWRNVSPKSIWHLGRLRKDKADELSEQGINEVSQIPKDTKLSESQWIEAQAVSNGQPKINHKAIRDFLQYLNLNEPLIFMDFESFMPAIPIYKGTKPYQQMCFQYSILRQENIKSDLIRKEFLAKPGSDPRRAFIENLLMDTDEEGSIIVYNQGFESLRLKELAIKFPEYAEEINERISRLKDLMEPFAKRHYYHPSFQGSHSIKRVLPALVPELSYKDLRINNGALAMAQYENFHKLSYKEQIQTKRDLLEYCHMDVVAMVRIVEALERIVSK